MGSALLLELVDGAIEAVDNKRRFEGAASRLCLFVRNAQVAWRRSGLLLATTYCPLPTANYPCPTTHDLRRRTDYELRTPQSLIAAGGGVGAGRDAAGRGALPRQAPHRVMHHVMHHVMHDVMRCVMHCVMHRLRPGALPRQRRRPQAPSPLPGASISPHTQELRLSTHPPLSTHTQELPPPHPSTHTQELPLSTHPGVIPPLCTSPGATPPL